MKSTNQEIIRQAFTQQAQVFESSKMNFSKKEYLDYVVRKIAPKKTDAILEVAAGTCLCGRTMASYAGSVTCLDMTPAMLTKGREEAEKAGLKNMHFLLGDAAELPFLDNSFDIVFSRLAFHHFPNIRRPFAEMVRILKPGGRLVLNDMEAPEEALREVKDTIEIMRDPSHVRNLSREEMLSLYRENKLTISCCETVKMPTVLQNWMDHTSTPATVQALILNAMQQDLHGGAKTGFAPYEEDGELKYNQMWVLVIGTKN